MADLRPARGHTIFRSRTAPSRRLRRPTHDRVQIPPRTRLRRPRPAEGPPSLLVRHYMDPARISWGPIRVWNDDEIAAQSSFRPHPHADTEIITYVRIGAITDEDSLGNKGHTAGGDVQVRSAGSGIRHAEFNLEPVVTTFSRSGLSPRPAAGRPARAASRSPKVNAPAASSPWPADLPMTPRPYPSAPTRAWPARI